VLRSREVWSAGFLVVGYFEGRVRVRVSSCAWNLLNCLSWTSNSCRISIKRASIRERRLATVCTTTATTGRTLPRRSGVFLGIVGTVFADTSSTVFCLRCQGARWICGPHPDRPWPHTQETADSHPPDPVRIVIAIGPGHLATHGQPQITRTRPRNPRLVISSHRMS
jgi:hypothetical protein